MTKQTKKGFLNETNLVFADISSEVQREYIFPNGSTLTIKEPLMLNVSKTGGHRIYTSDGNGYYVQPREGWAIKWVTKDGSPDFVI